MERGGKQHISRVLFTATGPGSLVAGVTICLGPPLPAASSGTGLKRNGNDGQPLFRGPKPWPCSRPGFTEPAPLDAAGALLPHPCTLTCAAGGPRPADRHRRCVSVALSSRSPAPGVTRQAWPLGSPDFPQPAQPPPEPRPLASIHRSRSPRLLSKDQVTQGRRLAPRLSKGPLIKAPWASMPCRDAEEGRSLAIG